MVEKGEKNIQEKSLRKTCRKADTKEGKIQTYWIEKSVMQKEKEETVK